MKRCPNSIISIIIPAYNAEKYIEVCLTSIQAQGYSDFEVILVDDGSKDRTAIICDEFVKKDSRINYYYKVNGGVSSARNFGLMKASGKYVTFIDSDDWVAVDYLQTLYKHANYADNILVIAGATYVYQYSSYEFDTFPLHFHLKDLPLLFLKQGGAGCICGKLIALDIIRVNNIMFDEKISFREDLLFWLDVIKYIEKVTYIPYYGYHYRCNSDSSLSGRFYKEKYIEQFQISKQIEKRMKELSISDRETKKYVIQDVFSITESFINRLFLEKKQSIRLINDIYNTPQFQIACQSYAFNTKSVKQFVFIFPLKFKLTLITYLVYFVRTKVSKIKKQNK